MRVLIFSLLSILVLAIGYYFIFFLRQPSRKIPYNDSLFVSPANGKILAVISSKELLDPGDKGLYKHHRLVIDNRMAGFESGATLISIMMTPRDVHYQKAPLQAKLLEEKHVPGKFWNAMKANPQMRSTFQNEHNLLLFETPEGFRFRLIQIAGTFARRILDYLHPGQEVAQGETRGLIKFGSQVSIILDQNFEVLAQVGEKVKEGESVLAQKIIQNQK